MHINNLCLVKTSCLYESNNVFLLEKKFFLVLVFLDFQEFLVFASAFLLPRQILQNGGYALATVSAFADC